MNETHILVDHRARLYSPEQRAVAETIDQALIGRRRMIEAKEFDNADAVRSDLLIRYPGIVIEDGKDYTDWRPGHGRIGWRVK
jgi:cysteinyl-tRNA synthetase